jgi:hypothetical protein
MNVLNLIDFLLDLLKPVNNFIKKYQPNILLNIISQMPFNFD